MEETATDDMALTLLSERFARYRADLEAKGAGEARRAAADGLFALYDGLLDGPRRLGGDPAADARDAAAVGMMAADVYLRDAVLAKMLAPELTRPGFDAIATGSPDGIVMVREVMDRVYERPDMNLRELTDVYGCGDPAAFTAGLALLLPVDWRSGAMEAAAYVSWARGDDAERTRAYLSLAFESRPFCQLGAVTAIAVTHDVRPAWRRDAQGRPMRAAEARDGARTPAPALPPRRPVQAR